MKRIYLIRHGETESNRKGIFRGRLDIPLSKRGKEQAYSLCTYFEKLQVDIVYTSPLSRAKNTAEIAFPEHKFQTEPLIDNLDLGEWSGQEKSFVKKKFPQQWEAWVKRPEIITFPGGENLEDVLKRSKLFLKKIVSLKEENIAAVSHRSVTKVLLAASIGLEKDFFWKFHLDNASVSQVLYEPERGYTLFKLNDTHHLKKTIMEWY